MKKWTVERPDEELVNYVDNGISVFHLSMQKYLLQEELIDPEEAKAFLHMDESSMHDPYLLYDMEKAVTQS